ncbi:hypothetical protein NP233_g10961 [Leucocoprinus birnbaumii]|uniref:DUF6533 domain-containing protein n=1 Tax=Leucocoprinus birnbaumii TaxID=56174 RepID=A0AAD5YLQ1_9AGAR|nr:hypothetical protein NP233_g10961 [Leucocoprinus birnbaumii]
MSAGLSSIDALLQLRQELEHGVMIWRNVNYAFVAGTTVMVIEWLQTLNLEVKVIWDSPRSILKALYLLSRYFPLVYWPVYYYYHFGSQGVKVHTCKVLFRYIVWAYIIATAFAES